MPHRQNGDRQRPDYHGDDADDRQIHRHQAQDNRKSGENAALGEWGQSIGNHDFILSIVKTNPIIPKNSAIAYALQKAARF